MTMMARSRYTMTSDPRGERHRRVVRAHRCHLPSRWVVTRAGGDGRLVCCGWWPRSRHGRRDRARAVLLPSRVPSWARDDPPAEVREGLMRSPRSSRGVACFAAGNPWREPWIGWPPLETRHLEVLQGCPAHEVSVAKGDQGRASSVVWKWGGCLSINNLLKGGWHGRQMIGRKLRCLNPNAAS